MAFDLGTIFAEIGVNTQKLDQGLMAAQTKLATADKSISSFGQKLTASSTKLLVSGGLMAGAVLGVAVASVKMAAQFETSMRNVNSISKLSETEFKALGESVIGISKKFPQTAKELADGLYDIASSGFSGAAGLKVLEASAMAASAGMTDTATSAKGVTAVLNAFGLEADQAGAVADTMFRTVDKGVITFEELSSTVGDWVGMSKAAGISFNEASGAIAYMTTKGINASEAGTSLQRMMTGMIKPSDAMAAVIKNAGFESGEMMLKTLGLTGSMKVLNDETGGSITKLIELIPEIRGVRGANALLGSGYESLTKFMGDFVDTTGSAAIALKEQSKSLEYQLKLLKNSATAIGIEIGNRLIPSITKYVTAADGMTAANTELIASNIILAAKMGGAVAGILLAGAAYGKIALFVKGVTTALTPLATAAGVTVTGLSSLAVLVGSMANRLGSITAAMDTGKLATMGWNERLQEFVNIFLLGVPEILTEIQRVLGATDAKTFEFGYGKMLSQLWDRLRGVKAATEETADASVPAYNKIGLAMEAASASMAGVAINAEKSAGAIAQENISAQASEKSAEELKTALDTLNNALSSGAISPQDYIVQLEKLGLTLNDVEGGFERVVTAAFMLFNANAASEQAIVSVDEALKKYNEALNATTGSTTANSEAAQAWLAGNKDYQIAVAKSSELEAKINKLRDEGKGTTSACLTAEKSLETQRGKLNELTNAAAAATGSYTSSGQQSEAQILATKAAAEGLSASIEAEIKTMQWEYMQTGTSVERQKELQNEFINSGLQAVILGLKTGDMSAISVESFAAMAIGFGMSSADIIAMADAMDIKMDYATRQRILYFNTDGAIRSANEFQQALDNMHDKTINITTYYRSIGLGMEAASNAAARKSMGGIVGYANGGTVGMPQAASGMVVPQTGRAYPILAHEYEDILNTSQQKNIAEWIMGKANSRPDSKSTSNEVILHTIINLDGQVLWENNEKFDLRKLGERV